MNRHRLSAYDGRRKPYGRLGAVATIASKQIFYFHTILFWNEAHLDDETR
jgi:hypothetical protein